MICVVCMTKAQADTSGKLPNQDAEEGEMALRSALRLGLGTDDTFAAPEFILEQIGALMLAAGKHACAVQATRQALGSSQKPSLNLLLARTLVQMNDLAAAIDAYQSVRAVSPRTPGLGSGAVARCGRADRRCADARAGGAARVRRGGGR